MPVVKKDLPPDRNFGLTMAAAAIVLAILLGRSGRMVPAALLAGLAAVLAVLAILKPGLLASLNRGWMMLGKAIGRVVSPIVLAILFFGLLTPMALLMRAFGRDELRLRRPQDAETYWRLREPLGPEPASFRRQF